MAVRIDNQASRFRLTSSASRAFICSTVVTRAGNVSHAIAEYAKHNAIDLIIVGTHGRGAIQRFLIGSVAERVMRIAPCPVLTVRAHERDFIDAHVHEDAGHDLRDEAAHM